MSGAQQWSIALTTALPADTLFLNSLVAEEHLSQPFVIHLTMTASGPVTASSLLGQEATVTLTDGAGHTRHLSGLMTRFTQNGLICTAELRPWLWMLSLTRDSRIFQSKTVPDILATLFSAAGYTAYQNSLKGSYATLDYCVQFQESGLDFASRLMEEAGICYFFTHSSAGHMLVLADDPACFTPLTNAASIPFLPLTGGADWLADLRVSTLSSDSRVAAQAYQADDYNFTTPATELKQSAGSGMLKVYEYPGRYGSVAAGETVATHRMEALQADAVQILGTSSARAMTAGGNFTLTGHPAGALNTTYTIRSVRHEAALREYANSFVAFPATVVFRPPRVTPCPRIAGSQTAIVTGPSGKEIYTDQYGRVKVQFNWDQIGTNDENSSCWIRVAQSWAGVSWGSFVLPRIGQEVVVTFLNGDPDTPLITGCVYNGTNTVPYPLPDEQTKTTFKSNSSSGGGGSNEFRFEDKKGSEEVFLQAQKDLTVTVLNSQTSTITQNRSVTVTKGDDSLTVSQGDRSLVVTKGCETHQVGGTRDVTTTGKETHTNKADFVQSVAGNHTLTVSGNIIIKASGDLTLEAGGGLTLKAGTALLASGGTTATVKAGTALSLQGGTSFELKGAATGAVDGGGMLTVKGGMVKLN